MKGDRRGFRVALCADALVNPSGGRAGVVGVLEEARFGLLQLPALDYPAPVIEGWLDQVAEQAEELHRHGYALVLLSTPDLPEGGIHRSALEGALAAFDLPLPPEHAVRAGAEEELAAFLAAQRPPALAS